MVTTYTSFYLSCPIFKIHDKQIYLEILIQVICVPSALLSMIWRQVLLGLVVFFCVTSDLVLFKLMETECPN